MGEHVEPDKAETTLASLDAQRELLEKKLQNARLEAELRALLTSPEARQAEQSDDSAQADFAKMMQAEVSKRLEDLRLPKPSFDPDHFVRRWVANQWDSKLRSCNALHGIPLVFVEEAMKAIYEQEYQSAENRAELAELHRNSEIDSGRTRSLFSVLKRGPEIRVARQHQRIQKLFTRVSVIFTASAAVFMFSMLFIGCIELSKAVVEGLTVPIELAEALRNSAEHSKAESKAVDDGAHNSSLKSGSQHQFLLTSLTALEIILVAPLPYLLVLALNRYIKALAYQERSDEFRRELLEFKAFEVALFIAIIAATAVSHILNNEFTLDFALPTAAIIGILAVYYHIIERSAERVDSDHKY